MDLLPCQSWCSTCCACQSSLKWADSESDRTGHGLSMSCQGCRKLSVPCHVDSTCSPSVRYEYSDGDVSNFASVALGLCLCLCPPRNCRIHLTRPQLSNIHLALLGLSRLPSFSVSRLASLSLGVTTVAAATTATTASQPSLLRNEMTLANYCTMRSARACCSLSQLTCP
ncbi:hypothetical protein RB213_010032 [Colletotrichum asianum]